MPTEIQKNYAKELRKIMKNHFPSTKISVTCRTFLSIDISWNDGPTIKEVKALIPEHRKIKTDDYGDVFSVGTYYHIYDRYTSEN